MESAWLLSTPYTVMTPSPYQLAIQSLDLQHHLYNVTRAQHPLVQYYHLHHASLPCLSCGVTCTVCKQGLVSVQFDETRRRLTRKCRHRHTSLLSRALSHRMKLRLQHKCNAMQCGVGLHKSVMTLVAIRLWHALRAICALPLQQRNQKGN